MATHYTAALSPIPDTEDPILRMARFFRDHPTATCFLMGPDDLSAIQSDIVVATAAVRQVLNQSVALRVDRGVGCCSIVKSQ